MMPHEDICFQLVDLPAISPEHSVPWLASTLQTGYGAACAPEPVSRACSDDLPASGGPINAICAAPSGRITSAGPPRVPPFLGRSSSSDSSLMRRLMEMIRPLVFGHHAEDLPQPLEALPRVARLAECGLCGLVLGRDVGGHKGVGSETGDLAVASSGSAGDTSSYARWRRDTVARRGAPRSARRFSV